MTLKLVSRFDLVKDNLNGIFYDSLAVKFAMQLSSKCIKSGLPDLGIFEAKLCHNSPLFSLSWPFVFFVFLTALMTIWPQIFTNLANLY